METLEKIILENINVDNLLSFKNFITEIFNNQKIVILLADNNIIPLTDDLKKIYPKYCETVRTKSIIYLKSNNKFNEKAKYLYKIFQCSHPTILGTQIDGDYLITGIADKHSFLCTMKSEIPYDISGNSEYHVLKNYIVPMDFFNLDKITIVDKERNKRMDQWGDEYGIECWENEINGLIENYGKKSVIDFFE